MLFNSYIFVLLFLPLCVFGYFALNHFKLYRISSLFLLAMSMWFYGYFNISYLPIIIGSIVVNYLFYMLFNRQLSERIRKLILAVAVLSNVGVLFYFKYYDFFFENINSIFGTSVVMKNLILPLGISFFTFQQLSFVIDSYHRKVPKYNFLNYALFVSFFPQLIAGPIVSHDELVPQLNDTSKKQINYDNIAKGLYIFALGLAKKVIVADTFGNAANWGFGNILSMNSADAIIVMLSYTFQIYFDFSGYCDMATGIAKMMNIDLPQNFNSPYKSLTITEFWSRWHMTLTRFFTKYIYIPLGGSRKGELRTYVNTMIVFVVSGIWHGAAWTFILWGTIHGLFMVITKKFSKLFAKIPKAINWLITFLFVNLAWVLFRADTISGAGKFIKQIFSMDFSEGLSANLSKAFRLNELILVFETLFKLDIEKAFPFLYGLIFLVAAFILVLAVRNAKEKMDSFRPTVKNTITTVLLLIWSIFSFAGISTFLYFNF